MTDGVNGTTMSGIDVTLYAADGTTVMATTTTNGSGDYIFTNVIPGDYIVGVTAPAGYSNVSSTDATPTDGLTNVTVAGTTNQNGIDFGLNEAPTANDDGVNNQIPGSPATVASILSDDNDPISGTLSPDNITLIPPTGATGVITDADGDVTGFTVPNEGTWVLNPDGS